MDLVATAGAEVDQVSFFRDIGVCLAQLSLVPVLASLRRGQAVNASIKLARLTRQEAIRCISELVAVGACVTSHVMRLHVWVLADHGGNMAVLAPWSDFLGLLMLSRRQRNAIVAHIILAEGAAHEFSIKETLAFTATVAPYATGESVGVALELGQDVTFSAESKSAVTLRAGVVMALFAAPVLFAFFGYVLRSSTIFA